jgi:hypothetical protein
VVDADDVDAFPPGAEDGDRLSLEAMGTGEGVGVATVLAFDAAGRGEAAGERGAAIDFFSDTVGPAVPLRPSRPSSRICST